VPRTSLIPAVVVALAVCLTTATPAAADKPVKEPLPFPDQSGQFCEDFPVRVSATVNREFIHIFSSGAALITGTFKVEVTNLDTGKTIAVNASGPGKISADETLLTAFGRLILFGEAGFFGPGAPPELSVNSGRTVISLTDGSILSQTGHSVDLCPLLAG